MLTTGLGSEILVYDLEVGKIMRSYSVFEGIRVHGITSSFLQATLIAVFGETRVKLFNFSFDTVPQLTLIHLLPKFGHWVLDVCFLKVLMNNEYLMVNNDCCLFYSNLFPFGSRAAYLIPM